MIARLQRLFLYALLLAAVLWLAAAAVAGLAWGWRLAGLALILLPQAPLLALEFALLARFGRSAFDAAPGGGELVRAWAGEVQASVQTFGWRQPFRADAVADQLPASAAGRRGLLLVHGFVCNRGLWLPWLRRLQALGTPFVALNLEPVFGGIDDYAVAIEQAVRRLERATGRPPLLVAHSMGGLAVRAWLRTYGADERIAGVVTIGTPHHGTWPARFGHSRNARQMRLDSRWLRDLAADEGPSRRARFTCFYGRCDNIVFPAATATLPGADNRLLPGVAHLRMIAHPAVFNEVLRRLSD